MLGVIGGFNISEEITLLSIFKNLIAFFKFSVSSFSKMGLQLCEFKYKM